MPRKGRVDRAGPYPNRTDLRSTQPVQVPTGLPYGDRQQLEQAQQAVPLPNGPPQQPDVHPVLAGAQQMQPPAGSMLAGPTTAPNEPLTAGIPLGAGPGPEALPGLGAPARYDTVNQLLTQLAASPDASPEVTRLAAYVQTGRL